MLSTAVMRNQCAHPQIQTKDFAKFARKTVYYRGEKLKQENAHEVLELITKLMELFT